MKWDTCYNGGKLTTTEVFHAKKMSILRPRPQQGQGVLLRSMSESGIKRKEKGQEGHVHLSLLRQGVSSGSLGGRKGQRQILFSALCRCLHQGAWEARQKDSQQGVQELRGGFYHPGVLGKKAERESRTILFAGLFS
jgi:hypothetical protein